MEFKNHFHDLNIIKEDTEIDDSYGYITVYRKCSKEDCAYRRADYYKYTISEFATGEKLKFDDLEVANAQAFGTGVLGINTSTP